MRSVVEIQDDIERLINERDAYEFGTFEYNALSSDIVYLQNELDEVEAEIDRVQMEDLYHRRDLQNRGLIN